MKNDLNTYELHLLGYLRQHNFSEADDFSFITARAEAAYGVFIDARLKGLDVSMAQELALATLMQDFDISFEDFLHGILDDQFGDRIPDYEYDIVIADMGELLDEYRERFINSQEFVDSTEGENLKYELIDVIDTYLDNYGL